MTQLGLAGVPRGMRSPLEALEALREAEAGGLSEWVIASNEKERLALSLQDCRVLAASIDEFELLPPEFERLIALTGLALGLDFRRKLTVGKTIYGRDREVDVLFRHSQSGNRLAIEAKYQRVKGTADEKLPYAVLNQKTLPLPSVIVYGGGGFHHGALHWLCASARATDVAGLAEWLAVFSRCSAASEIHASRGRRHRLENIARQKSRGWRIVGGEKSSFATLAAWMDLLNSLSRAGGWSRKKACAMRASSFAKAASQRCFRGPSRRGEFPAAI